MQTFKIRCSDLAKLTGHNTFQTQEDTIDMLNQYNGFCDTSYSKNEVQKILNIMSDSQLKEVSECIGFSNDGSSQNDNSLLSYIEKMSDSDLKQCNKELYFARKSEQNKKRGIDNESSCVPLIEEELNVKISNSNDKVYIKELFRTSKYKVILLGAVDGITNDGRVVEIKTRTQRLFNKLREYEQVQLEGYLYLTGYTNIILYENYGKKGNYIHYDHDEDFWNECIESVKEFIEINF